MTKALILLSGGLDSLTVLAQALHNKCTCATITFQYGQRHHVEIEHAKKIAAHYAVPNTVLTIDPATMCQGKSSLINHASAIEENRSLLSMINTPSTYVPGRNTLFIAHALTFAETIGASEIHIGANLHDASGFPDTRPGYFAQFQQLINLLTPIQLITPLIHLTKREVVQLAMAMNAPIDLSFSCYNPQDGMPCGRCDACIIREKAISGFF